MKKTNHRLVKINEEIRKEMSQIISSKLKDPRIHPMTSVVRAETTPDLKFCKVFISVLGSEEESNHTVEALKHSAGYIRNELAHIINLRNTPELKFVNDHSIAYGIDIAKKLEVLMSEISEDKSDEDETE